jgi:hypothetical protein
MALLNIAFLWITCAAANFVAAPSGILEVDLLFPRNGTWKPTSIMPIVFAVQQPQLGVLIQRQIIRWRLGQVNNASRSIHEGTATFDLNATTSGLYLATGISDALAGIEGGWEIQWMVSLRNCTQLSSENTRIEFSAFAESRSTFFQTNDSAPAPSVETALSIDSCQNLDYLVYNVSAVQPVPKGYDTELYLSCAALGDSSVVTGSPCSININAAASTSASAAISYSTCRVTSTACVSPPSTTKTSAATRLKTSTILLSAILSVVGSALLLTA